jgi:hypothetical protein
LGVSLRGGALGATLLGPGYRCKPLAVVALVAPPPPGFTLYPSRKTSHAMPLNGISSFNRRFSIEAKRIMEKAHESKIHGR